MQFNRQKTTILQAGVISFTILDPVYTKINPAADCCRDNGANVGEVGNGGAIFPSDCESACNAKINCLYFSHAASYKNCQLCSKCDFTSGTKARKYTSWKRNPGKLQHEFLIGTFHIRLFLIAKLLEILVLLLLLSGTTDGGTTVPTTTDSKTTAALTTTPGKYIY